MDLLFYAMLLALNFSLMLFSILSGKFLRKKGVGLKALTGALVAGNIVGGLLISGTTLFLLGVVTTNPVAWIVIVATTLLMLTGWSLD